MNCPSCNETLLMTERQTIEIDYCPKCRGVWLDKGELDKIIEKSLEQEAPAQNQQNQNQNQQNQNYNDPYNQRGHHGDGGHHGGYSKHGKRGFLGNLFDF
ncbi:MAG: zf-TFIIB domain-containing protein [Bacteroidota bacterium]|jgi:Zn-finger nucleic acid-binding protein